MNEFNLIDIINKKTCNKFEFLRLKQVFFDESKNMCQIAIIYPNNINLEEKDKDLIIEIIKEELNLKNALVVVKINKSFVESDLIKQNVLYFLQKKCPVFYAGVIEGCYSGKENKTNNENLSLQIKIVDNNTFENVGKFPEVEINFLVEKGLDDYFYKYKIDKKLDEYLSKNFCANFKLSAKSLNFSSNVQYDYLEKKLQEIKTRSDVEAMLDSTSNKFLVKNKKKLIGDEIEFNPRYIKTINSTMDCCCVAGKVGFLTERSYKSKRVKKNKDGTEEPIVKPYFNFNIKDETGNINVVVFPTKEGYHKMHLFKDGDTVLIQGRVDKYNGKFEIMAKKISLCEIPLKQEVIQNVNSNDITSYKFVKPIKYTSTKQANLFDEGLSYSKEVLNHSFVVYDFETTGVDTQNDEIIEIGALKIENGVFTQVFTTLVNPKRHIPEGATKVNRITDEMVSNCFYIEQVIQDFYLFCKDCQMVGYNNISFDSQFLVNAARKVGMDFNNTQLDAFILAKQKLKGLHNYKLGTVAKYLEVNLVDAHRALNDVLATAEVFLKLY